ncbi:MAG: DapH/DapD/GlmU-related protein [Candidatus Omnitrophota bacterium]
MKAFLKRVVLRILAMMEPAFNIAAEFYGVDLRKKYRVYGQNPVIFEDPETERRFVPRSTYFNTRSGSIFVGANAMFGENVMVITGKHLDISEASRKSILEHSVPQEGRDIHIGRDCFIGSGAIINGKVKIGDHSVIGAGAVVTKDVPEKVFVAGVPAKIVKQL